MSAEPAGFGGGTPTQAWAAAGVGPKGRDPGVDVADGVGSGPFPGEPPERLVSLPLVSEVLSVKCRIGGHLSQRVWGWNGKLQGVL